MGQRTLLVQTHFTELVLISKLSVLELHVEYTLHPPPPLHTHTHTAGSAGGGEGGNSCQSLSEGLEATPLCPEKRHHHQNINSLLLQGHQEKMAETGESLPSLPPSLPPFLPPSFPPSLSPFLPHLAVIATTGTSNQLVTNLSTKISMSHYEGKHFAPPPLGAKRDHSAPPQV